MAVLKCLCVIWLSLLRWETLPEVLVQSATRLPWGHLHLTHIPDLLGDIIIKVKQDHIVIIMTAFADEEKQVD